MIYEPAEDSFLLQKYVKKYAKGIVLDIGTGTGIQALEATKSKKVSKVYAIDINSEAITYCRNKINNKKIIFLTSNLFSAFENLRFKGIKFDTILFNAPYLPRSNPKDLALDGGTKGSELIQRFFYEAKSFLKPKTKILLIFSSLTDKNRIEQIITRKNMHFKELEKIHISFEDIFIYLIELNSL